MRTILFLILTISIFSCKNDNPKASITTPVKQEVVKTDKIEILDFHTAHRCKACISIEANTRETLNKFFSNEIKSGKLVFRLINADATENESIVDDYGAYGTSLFINVIKDGKENHIDLTNFAFKKEANKKVFMSELRTMIEKELKKI